MWELSELWGSDHQGEGLSSNSGFAGQRGAGTTAVKLFGCCCVAFLSVTIARWLLVAGISTWELRKRQWAEAFKVFVKHLTVRKSLQSKTFRRLWLIYMRRAVRSAGVLSLLNFLNRPVCSPNAAKAWGAGRLSLKSSSVSWRLLAPGSKSPKHSETYIRMWNRYS